MSRVRAGKPVSVALAWAALAWERAVPLWWPAVAFPAAFLVAAVFGVWDAVGDPWRLAALAGSGFAGLGFFLHGRGRTRAPSVAEARRRVEEDARLSGRPFEALEDKPAAGDVGARALWRAHQERMRARLKAAKTRRPKAALAAADTPALRVVLVIAGGVGVALAGGAAVERVRDAFAPRFLAPLEADAKIEAWLNPPAYTNRAPIFLNAVDGAADAPEGSEAVVRVSGAARPPRLSLITAAGRTRVAFEEAGGDSYIAKTTLDEHATLTVDGRARASWDVRVIPDRPPLVEITDGPTKGRKQELVFTYAVDDDYGAADAALEIRREDDPGLAPLVEPLEPPAAGGRIEARVDLTEHPWAGLPVALRVTARDAKDQVGESGVIRLDLPERVFVVPLAKSIAHERKRLIRTDAPYAELAADVAARVAGEFERQEPRLQLDQSDVRIDRAPPAIKSVAKALTLISRGPEIFQPAPQVQLALAYARDRVLEADEREDLNGLEDVLWDAALFAEGGELADAERALRAAEKALAEALARGDDPAEIEKLMEAYKEAADRYMEALVAQAMINGDVLEGLPGAAGGEMSADQIQEMMKALQDLAATGANADARRLLQALSEMLLNMQIQLAMGQGSGGELSPDLQALQEALEELGELIGEQRGLMDETFAENEGAENEGAEGGDGQPQPGPGQQPGDGQQPQPGDGAQPGSGPPRDGLSGESSRRLAGRQGALGDEAGEVRDGLGSGAGEEEGEDGQGGRAALEDAEDAMRRAAEALGEGDGQYALNAQGEAIEALRDAAEALAREAMEAQREANQGGFTDGLGTPDPFGRPTGGAGQLGQQGVEIPSEMERRRAREILDELRKRSGDAERPRDELDYIKRLLDRF